MVWLMLDYVILGLFFTAILIYVERKDLKNVSDFDKFLAFVILFTSWWAILIYDLIVLFVKFIVNYK